MTPGTTNVHAGCVLLGETGLLIQGAPGSGKSTLARTLAERWRARDRFAAIVSDDRTLLSREGARLVARPHPVIAGRMEVRGVGIVDEHGESAAVVHALIEISADRPERLPKTPQRRFTLLGLELPVLKLDSGRTASENAAIVEIWLNSAIKS